MDELSVLPVHARIDEHIAKRSVFAAHASGISLQLFTRCQTFQDVRDDVLIRVKFRDVPANVLLARVTQQVELGLIDSLNDSVGADPVQSNVRALEEVAEFGFATPQ